MGLFNALPNQFAKPIVRQERGRQVIGKIGTMIFAILLAVFVAAYLWRSLSTVVPTTFTASLDAILASRVRGEAPSCACSRQSFPIKLFTNITVESERMCRWAQTPVPTTIRDDLSATYWRYLLRFHDAIDHLCIAANQSVHHSELEFLDSTFSSQTLLDNATLQSEPPVRARAVFSRNGVSFATPFSHIRLWASLNMPVPVILEGEDRQGQWQQMDMAAADAPCLQQFSSASEFLEASAADRARLCPELFVHYSYPDTTKLGYSAALIPSMAPTWEALCALAATPAGPMLLGPVHHPELMGACTRVPQERAWVEYDAASGECAGKPPQCGARDYLRVQRIKTSNNYGACDCAKDWQCVARDEATGQITACDSINLVLHQKLVDAWPRIVVDIANRSCAAGPPRLHRGMTAEANATATRAYDGNCWIMEGMTMLQSYGEQPIMAAVRRMFVTRLSVAVSFRRYFQHCAPSTCTVLLPPSAAAALSSTVATVGGLKTGLQVAFSVLVSLTIVLHGRREKGGGGGRGNKVGTASADDASQQQQQQSQQELVAVEGGEAGLGGAAGGGGVGAVRDPVFAAQLAQQQNIVTKQQRQLDMQQEQLEEQKKLVARQQQLLQEQGRLLQQLLSRQ